jgi:Type II secretion system (T2SS), protein F
MTAPEAFAVAALLAVLTVSVALRSRGSFRGRRSLRGSRWVAGGGRRWSRTSRSRRRRSGLLEQPVPSETPPDARRPGGPGRAAQRSGGPHRGDPIEVMRRRIPMPGRAAARRREQEEAVPEVVDVLRATVAAGINPRRALQAAAEGAPPALSGLLGQAIHAAELGAGAGQALAAAARAERLTELELAGEALDLAETTGAPPGPVLAGVATAATDRVRSRQALLAATAQARLSARVVAAMAPAFLGVLALTSPSDAAFLVREPAGWATLTAATVLELLGICWATRIVRGPAP